jgi:hypothetical protein
VSRFSNADRSATFPTNSPAVSLLLNSATSSAKTYRRFAIKCVRSQPRFSNRHADTLDKRVISQKRCNDIGGMYSGGTVLCEIAEEFKCVHVRRDWPNRFCISNGRQNLSRSSTNPSTMWRLGLLLRGKRHQTRQISSRAKGITPQRNSAVHGANNSGHALSSCRMGRVPRLRIKLTEVHARFAPSII